MSNSNYWKPLDEWKQRYGMFIQNATLRNDSYKWKKTKSARCKEFPKSFGENLNIVMNYRLNVSNELLKCLDLDSAGIKKISDLKAEFPIYNSLKLIYYDIGLTSSKLTLLRKHCRCEVRIFPFEKYPHHVRTLKAYTWKPIIIQTMLQEFPLVLWQDASIRFKETRLDSLFSKALETGIKIRKKGGSIAVRTHPNTFKALGEEPCMFTHPELETGWILIKRSKFTLNGIMKPWMTCALQYECMTHPQHQTLLYCPIIKNRRQNFGICHRFDQSVMSIILICLFNSNIKLALFKSRKYGYVARNTRSNYFEVMDAKVR